MDTTTELAALRRIVAGWIFRAYTADSAGDPGELARVQAESLAADRLHEEIAAGGIDLAPELDDFADVAAGEAFARFAVAAGPPESRAYDPSCTDCRGTGRRRNEYHHECPQPLCQGDAPTVECECGDGPTVVVLGEVPTA